MEVEATSVAYSAGGVWPCICGTGLLVIGSMIVALAVGICSAIYLSDRQNTRSIRLIRIAILNLAGVPSIVFGLFGFGLFVIFFHWNVSLLAGWFTLGLVLPAIVSRQSKNRSERCPTVCAKVRSLSVPQMANHSQERLTLAIPGISFIHSRHRRAGETAPIMFTAAYALRDEMPWQVQRWTDFVFQGVMALPMARF